MNTLRKTNDSELASLGIDESQTEGLPCGCYEIFDNGEAIELIDTGGLSVNCQCLVVAPTLPEAQTMLDDTDPEASGCDETHLWLPAMNYRYAIWRESAYEVKIGAASFTSEDGDNWTDENGVTAKGGEFESATIQLTGGPRDGTVVA